MEPLTPRQLRRRNAADAAIALSRQHPADVIAVYLHLPTDDYTVATTDTGRFPPPPGPDEEYTPILSYQGGTASNTIPLTDLFRDADEKKRLGLTPTIRWR